MVIKAKIVKPIVEATKAVDEVAKSALGPAYKEAIEKAPAVKEAVETERQAIEEKILKRGTFFNRKFDYCDVHEGSFQQ